jgi:DNA-binding transcriptional regulator YhcF (GntR family)
MNSSEKSFASMNASEKTLTILHERIISGHYKLNDYMNPRDLCEDLKVSPVPVREALIRLSERQLLEWDRNRGFRIARLEIRDVMSVYEQLQSLYCNGITRLSQAAGEFNDSELSEVVNAEPNALDKNIEMFTRNVLTPREQFRAGILWNQLWYIRLKILKNGGMMIRTASDITQLKLAILNGQFSEASEICERSFRDTSQDVINMMAIDGWAN